MTKRELIRQHALRCRPSKRDTYVTTHEALLAEAEYLQQTQPHVHWLDREWRETWQGNLIVSAIVTIVYALLCLPVVGAWMGWFA